MIRDKMFWAQMSPLACLSGGGLVIMASDRLAHAVTVTGALVWVYCLTMLATHAGLRIFPKRGRAVLIAFLASFIVCVFLLLLWILSPLCAMQTFFVVAFVPVIVMGSEVFTRFETLTLGEKLVTSLSEALVLGVLIIIFALIREPFGFLSLSLPGGTQGLILLFSFDVESLLPVRLVASSSGALLLLGYFLGLYQHFKGAAHE